jgi:2Fe-2S ferredoxin
MEELVIYVTDPDGVEHALDAISGWQVMEIIRDHGLPIKAECGGACCCATCHVYVDPEWMGRVQPKSDDEDAMLDNALQVTDQSRLSCQLIMSSELNGLRLRIAPNPD